MEQQPPAGNLNPKALQEKAITEALAVLAQNGIQASGKVGSSKTSRHILRPAPRQKKIDDKVAGKEQDRQDKIETQSASSGNSNISKISKVTVGSKLSNGATVKEVKEDDWIITDRKDKNSNIFYGCKHCRKECRKYDRKTHRCNV